MKKRNFSRHNLKQSKSVMMKKVKIVFLLLLIFFNVLGTFFWYDHSTQLKSEKIAKSSLFHRSSTTILIIYGDHDAGSGGQRYNEFKSYLENMGYTVDTIHINTFILDPSVADLYNLLIIDRSCTSSHNVIKDTGKPILALGYGGGLFFTNALGFPSVTSQGSTQNLK